MPGSFAITTVTNNVPLGETRKSQVAFTVSNTNTQPMRGRANVVPLTPVAAPWLTLVGEPERTLPPAATEQYSVQISVPPSIPAGSYSFRLDMVGVDNPDEDFVQGPSVSFTIPAPVPVKKPFPWWIVAAVIVVLLLLAGGFYLFRANQDSAARQAGEATQTRVALEQTAAAANAQGTASAAVAAQTATAQVGTATAQAEQESAALTATAVAVEAENAALTATAAAQAEQGNAAMTATAAAQAEQGNAAMTATAAAAAEFATQTEAAKPTATPIPTDTPVPPTATPAPLPGKIGLYNNNGGIVSYLRIEYNIGTGTFFAESDRAAIGQWTNDVILQPNWTNIKVIVKVVAGSDAGTFNFPGPVVQCYQTTGITVFSVGVQSTPCRQ